MSEILLMGVGVVAVYLLAHELIVRIERWRGASLGVWRTPVFFVVFLAPMVVLMSLLERVFAS